MTLGGLDFSSMRPIKGRGRRGLLDLQVLRGCLPAVLDELELNGLTLVQSAKAGTLDCRDVDEHILSTFLRLDKAIALRRVEPLNCALRHARSPELQRNSPVWHRHQRLNKVRSGLFGALIFHNCSKKRRLAAKDWCPVRGLNSRPSVYKTAALPLS